jgi:hypothetical protein
MMDDPRIEALDRQRRIMRLANRYARQGHRQGLLDMGYSPAQVERLLTPNILGEVGFPQKQILAVSEKIKRMRKARGAA